jgi:hypothetical protein
VEEDLLRPADEDPEEDRTDDVAEETGREALNPERADSGGIDGPEHFGLTPPD